jgi:hypothetical protein
MTQLHNNYKDVFRCFRLGFSAKKIAMMIWGLILALAGYVVVSYIAYLSMSWTLTEIWGAYRLFPVPESLTWYAWIIWLVGAIYALCVILISGTAISKVTFEQLKGDDFYQMSKAYKYAMKQGKSIIMSPALVILFIISIVVAGLILSLLGAIPYFGEIFTGLMIIPAFGASLFIVYLFIVFMFTIMFAPAIVATTGNDTFDTLFEVFSMINDQPARLVWYTIIAGVLSRVGMILLGAATRIAVNVGANILSVFMGGKFIDVLYNAASTFKFTIPYWCPEPFGRLAEAMISTMFGSAIFSPPSYQHINIAILLATIFVAIAYYLIILFVVAYGSTVWFTGAFATYLVIVKKKDDRNLLETKEEKFSTAEEKAAEASVQT